MCTYFKKYSIGQQCHNHMKPLDLARQFSADSDSVARIIRDKDDTNRLGLKNRYLAKLHMKWFIM